MKVNVEEEHNIWLEVGPLITTLIIGGALVFVLVVLPDFDFGPTILILTIIVALYLPFLIADRAERKRLSQNGDLTENPEDGQS